MTIESKIYSGVRQIPQEVIARWNSNTDLVFDQTHAWFALLGGEVLAEDYNEKTLLVCDESTDDALAVLPLALAKKAGLPFGIHELRSLTNYYSSSFGLVRLAAVPNSDVVDAACRGIAGLGRESRLIELGPVAKDSEFFPAMVQALKRNGYTVSPYRRFANWYHVTNGQTFSEYFDGLGSKTRNTYKRKKNKLDKQGYDIEIALEAGDVDAAVDDYEVVYQSSWKIDESHPVFIRELCKMFAASGWLRLGILRVAGTPIAAQIWFVKDGVASIFKLSYDEQYKSLSAGTILTMALFRHVLDVDRVAKVDYLTGDDPYKREYMNSCQELWAIRAYRRRSLAGIFGVYDNIRKVGKLIANRMKKGGGRS